MRLETILSAVPTLGENYGLAKQFGPRLIENCRDLVNGAPLCRDGMLI